MHTLALRSEGVIGESLAIHADRDRSHPLDGDAGQVVVAPVQTNPVK